MYPVVFDTRNSLQHKVFECPKVRLSRQKIRNFATVQEYHMPLGLFMQT